METDLPLNDIADLAELGMETYRQRVIALFTSHRATAEMWQAMSEAVLWMSESEYGHKVRCIDTAVLGAAKEEPHGPRS